MLEDDRTVTPVARKLEVQLGDSASDGEQAGRAAGDLGAGACPDPGAGAAEGRTAGEADVAVNPVGKRAA
ncbi:hypothetical protein C1I98_31130 [Spongiactinospora gelatinilytica]|uniref:Uncharacterized protein n=1 Tax=Spongiactinospora gelatinilytica TaxID=2666298 RepID=A0A2W2F2T1_9ACTN|nr:hypothetical protein C1I98_31130 [Spongiactinospora gelatinilytica]